MTEFEAQTLALQQVMIEEIRALRESIEQQRIVAERRPQRPLRPEERNALTVLLPAVYGAFSDRWFLVRELFAAARPKDASALVLRDALRTAAGGDSKVTARLLHRAKGQSIGGLMVRASEKPLNAGLLWVVVREGDEK